MNWLKKLPPPTFFDELDADVFCSRMARFGMWWGIIEVKKSDFDLKLKVDDCKSPAEVFEKLEAAIRSQLNLPAVPVKTQDELIQEYKRQTR